MNSVYLNLKSFATGCNRIRRVIQTLITEWLSGVRQWAPVYQSTCAVLVLYIWLKSLYWRPVFPTFFGIVTSCPIISVTLWNRQSHIRAHFTQRVIRCAEVRKWAGFDLLSQALSFHSLREYFYHFLCDKSVFWVQHYECHPGLNMSATIPIFKQLLPL